MTRFWVSREGFGETPALRVAPEEAISVAETGELAARGNGGPRGVCGSRQSWGWRKGREGGWSRRGRGAARGGSAPGRQRAGSGRRAAAGAAPWRAGLRRGLRWGDLTRLLLEVGPPGRTREEGRARTPPRLLAGPSQIPEGMFLFCSFILSLARSKPTFGGWRRGTFEGQRWSSGCAGVRPFWKVPPFKSASWQTSRSHRGPEQRVAPRVASEERIFSRLLWGGSAICTYRFGLRPGPGGSGHPRCPLGARHGWWLLPCPVGEKAHLLFRFQPPRA